MKLTKYKLGDIADISAGGDAPKNYTTRKTDENTIPIYSNGVENEGLYGYTNCGKITKPAFTVSARGTIGISFRRYTPYVPIVRLLSIVPTSNVVDLDYLYYYSKTILFRKDGSVQQQLTVPMLANMDVELPDLDTQRRIASVLSNLDRKIALNRQINTNLEALARQLYDYWFVQFDFPNADGQPYKSSGGKMVYNEHLKREIPEGWTSTSLSNILDVLKDGTHNPPQRCSEGVPLLTGTMFGDVFLDYKKATYISVEDYNEIHKKYQPQENDIIITKIGTIGNINILRKSDIPIAIHCNSALLRFKKMYSGPYALLFCKSKHFYNRLYAAKGQSIQEFVGLDRIANVPVECPTQEVLAAFNKMLKPIVSKLERTHEEITSLTRQRDELLPLLMNGQVTIE